MTSREDRIEEAAKAILDAAETPESVRDEQMWEWARRDARAALAVFEAYSKDFRVAESGDDRSLHVTPTDDEREAVFNIIDRAMREAWTDADEYAYAPAYIRDAILAAGFRRPVQAEQGEREARIDEDGLHLYWFDPVEGCWVAFRRVDCVGEEELPDRRLPRVEQAQAPTDDEREALEDVLRREFEYRIRTSVAYGAMKSYREIRSQVRADWIQGEISKAMSVARVRVLDALRRPVRAEPSDAVVIRSLEAYWGPQSTGRWLASQINAMRAALRAAAATEVKGEGR